MSRNDERQHSIVDDSRLDQLPPGWRFTPDEPQQEAPVRIQCRCTVRNSVSGTIAAIALGLSFAAFVTALKATWLVKQVAAAQTQQEASQHDEKAPQHVGIARIAGDSSGRAPVLSGHKNRLERVIDPLAQPDEQHTHRAKLHDVVRDALRLDGETKQQHDRPQGREGLVPSIDNQSSEWVRHSLSVATAVRADTGAQP